MEELVLYMAKALVDQPDMVQVTREDGVDSIILTLKVAPEDMGKVIGKQGRIAKSMRAVLRSASIKEGKRVILDIG